MQPVYGPSTPSPYQQFYDVTTGLPMQPPFGDDNGAHLRHVPSSRGLSPADDINFSFGAYPYHNTSPTMPVPSYDPSPISRTGSSPLLSTAEEMYTRLTREDSYRLSREDSFRAPPRLPTTEGCACIYCRAAEEEAAAQWPIGEVDAGAGFTDAPPTSLHSAPLPTSPNVPQQHPAPKTPPPQSQQQSMPSPHKTELTPGDISTRGRTAPLAATPKTTCRKRKGAERSAGSASPSATPSTGIPSPKTEPKRQSRLPTFLVDILGHHDRVLVVRSSMEVTEGDYVVFDGDRGVDMGRVHRISTVSSRPDVERPSERPMVIRSATTDEIKLWTTTLVEDAEAAIPVCQEVADRLGVRLAITSASYQLDRQKLTFFYDSPQRVDFRRLLSPLFTKYRCRIWLERNAD